MVKDDDIVRWERIERAARAYVASDPPRPEWRELMDALGMGQRCSDPTHAEPYACHRVAEGGFVCESTLQLEKLIYAIPGGGAPATFRWHHGVIEQLVDEGEWRVLFEPEGG